MRLRETVALTALSLSETQKAILCKIFAAPDIPDKMGKKIDLADDREVTSKQMLEDMGLITIDPESGLATITDKGTEIMQQENLIDETNQLTAVGQDYVTPPEEQNKLAQPGDQQGLSSFTGMPATGNMGAAGSPMANGPMGMIGGPAGRGGVMTMGFTAYLKANSTLLD